jgi:hypothetical protein
MAHPHFECQPTRHPLHMVDGKAKEWHQWTRTTTQVLKAMMTAAQWKYSHRHNPSSIYDSNKNKTATDGDGLNKNSSNNHPKRFEQFIFKYPNFALLPYIEFSPFFITQNTFF